MSILCSITNLQRQFLSHLVTALLAVLNTPRALGASGNIAVVTVTVLQQISSDAVGSGMLGDNSDTFTGLFPI